MSSVLADDVAAASTNDIGLVIRSCEDPNSLAAARALIRAHIETASPHLKGDVLDAILDGLPAAFRPPRGALWVAWHEGRPLGCAAIHEFERDVAELKRMYVHPDARGRGVGRQLTLYAIAMARAKGYSRLRLGTLATSTPAQRLYSSLGFQLIAPYRPAEFGKTWFYELALT